MRLDIGPSLFQCNLNIWDNWPPQYVSLTQIEILSNTLRFKFEYLKKLRVSVNQPKSPGPKTSIMIEFKFKHVKNLRMSVNQPKSSGLRTPVMIEFKFKHLKELRTIVN